MKSLWCRRWPVSVVSSVALSLSCGDEGRFLPVSPQLPGTPEVESYLGVALDIWPHTPRTGDALRAHLRAAEPATPTSWLWTVDGRHTDYKGPSVPSGVTRRGEQWTVSVQSDHGPARANRQIQNAPPGSPVLRLEPVAPMAGLDDLHCAVTRPADDPDGDTIVHQILWWVDGEPFDGDTGATNRPGDTVPTDTLVAGQAWTCAVTAVDALGAATSADVSATVEAFDITRLDPAVPLDLELSPYPFEPGSPLTVTYRGALARESNLVLRVGWDGWIEVDGMPEPILSLAADGTRTVWSEVALSPDGDAHIVTFDVPEGVEAVHMTVVTADGATVDDAGGAEYHAAIDFPYLGPVLTWTDAVSPSDGVVVTWETDVLCRGVVEYRVDGGPTKFAVGTTPDLIHHVALEGLPADTEVAYRVYDNIGSRSDEFQMRTAPAGATTARFAVASDMQDDGTAGQRWPDVAQALFEQDLDFLMMPGDLAANDHPGLWWRFFHEGRDLFASVPVVPAVGNHDTPSIWSDPDTTSYRRFFALSERAGTKDYYAQTWGQILILSVSTEFPTDLSYGGSQYAWLEAELAATRDEDGRLYDWVFAQYHRPSYDVGRRFTAEVDQFRPMTALFDGAVDFAFMGHEHIYQRFLPLRHEAEVAERYSTDDDGGVGYVVLPSAGLTTLHTGLVTGDNRHAAQRQLLSYPELTEDQTETAVQHGFVVVELDQTSMTLESYAMGTADAPSDPAVIDRVRVER